MKTLSLTTLLLTSLVLATPLMADGGAPVQEIACSAAKTTKSVSAGPEVKLTFTNVGDAPIDLSWLNYTGETVYFTTIYPHWTHTQTTFATLVWMLSDEDGNCLRIIAAPATATTLDISTP